MFAQVDMYERAAAIFTVIAIVVVSLGYKYIVARDEERDGNAIALFLTGVTLAGVIVVIVAAALGPHPA